MKKYDISRKKVIAELEDYATRGKVNLSTVKVLLLVKEPKPKQIFEPKPYLCCESKYCSKRFATIEELNDHKETHESDKDFETDKPDYYKLSDGKWHHIPCVDGKIYLDGRLVKPESDKEKCDHKSKYLRPVNNKGDYQCGCGEVIHFAITEKVCHSPKPFPIKPIDVNTKNAPWETVKVAGKVNEIINYLAKNK